MQSNKAVLSEWNLQSWEGRHYETSVRTLQDEEKPFIQKGEIIHSWTGIILRSCNMNASSHTDFLLVLEMTSSLTCRDFHNNSVSVMYMIELATAESNTQFIPDLIVPACCQQQCVSWQAILAFFAVYSVVWLVLWSYAVTETMRRNDLLASSHVTLKQRHAIPSYPLASLTTNQCNWGCISL